MKAVVAAFNQEKALVGAFFVIVKLREGSFIALVLTDMYPFARYLLLKRSLFVGLFAKQEAEQTGGQRARGR